MSRLRSTAYVLDFMTMKTFSLMVIFQKRDVFSSIVLIKENSKELKIPCV
jgi:hypothetical protein